MTGIRFPGEAGIYPFLCRVQPGSGAHPAIYPVGTAGVVLN